MIIALFLFLMLSVIWWLTGEIGNETYIIVLAILYHAVVLLKKGEHR